MKRVTLPVGLREIQLTPEAVAQIDEMLARPNESGAVGAPLVRADRSKIKPCEPQVTKMIDTKVLIEDIKSMQSLCDDAVAKENYPLLAIIMTSLSRKLKEHADSLQKSADTITEGHVSSLMSANKTMRRAKHEGWLQDNPVARESVERGLEQARRGEFVAGPSDLDSDAK